jgi:transglycosylase-like protein with SLT domain
MAVVAPSRIAGALARKPRARRARRTRIRPLVRASRRALLVFLAAPLVIRLLVGAILVVLIWSAVNWAYQVIRKPTELFFPVSGTLSKMPPETWRQYAPLFREHSTATISPELLAALAQVEGSGNPVARTYWRWQVSWNPFAVYRPASSAVGMYQITDPTFREAKRLCIHDHVVVEDGAWHNVKSCWFNALYTRVVPSHAVELTAALLDRDVARTLERRRIVTATLRQKQDLAAIIHLCGVGGGDTYAQRGFGLAPGQQCGDHDVGRYLAQVNGMKRRFARLAAAEPAETFLSRSRP